MNQFVTAGFLLIVALGGNPVWGQARADAGPAVRYALSFPNAVHHEARVTVTFAGLPQGPLRVRMARSSPGRYALHEFSKNVYYVVATDGRNQRLPLNRPDQYGWDVTPGADGTVVFSYTLYADRTDGTYSGIDEQHAHLNIPATLCYATGLESRPAEVKFDLPATWKVATQLRPGAEPNTFTAPNMQYLMDSPVSLGDQQVRTWQEGKQTIELAVLHQGTGAELDAYAKKVQQVVKEEKAIFGELPAFDFGRYTFIANYLPQAISDGMEHRNSTSLTSPRPLREDAGTRNLGTAAHEFIHAWNVERLRPRDLEPFDFQRANMSDALWFAEGFTSYLSRLALRRAKLISDEEFLGDLSRWVNLHQLSPGPRKASAIDMSRQAAFIDAAASIDPMNSANNYLSYYDHGAGIALVLDLQLRQNHKTSLDKYMQALWQQFGKKQADYAPTNPYTVKDLQRVLGEVSKDTAFAGKFFRQHVYGYELPSFGESLLGAGLALVPVRSSVNALARQIEFDQEGRAVVADNTRIGTGLYQAGIDRGDQLVSLDGKELKRASDLEAVLRKHTPADVVPVKFRTTGGLEKTAQLALSEEPVMQLKPVETVEKAGLTARQKALRDAWLASQAGN
ncbi:M61 family metallopeptidase [Hymenobacter arizonensis]|uniref:Predicted metalloprotease, contains C-terminal PDZ domain n=1 Tax=Hymenobacter arizonensis TaxID=1227077 RepID=A0A1I5V6Z7_HYMAR|nr:M61 family metallopeptidase [Hymenobacter arizonensis]SFQ02736.1 Predicted metalloprotease, contains C-terminal PDZ domain [Hymenobacter arizonensis]